MTVSKTREELVKMYIDSLKEGDIPWRQRWTTSLNINGVSNIEYKGINQLLLSLVTYNNKYNDNRWLTFKQIKDKGYKLKDGKGKGVPVEFWSVYDIENKRRINLNEYEKILIKNPELKDNYRLFCNTSYVFNGSLIEGLPELEQSKNKKESSKFINKLINDYWFLTDDIVNDNIYYKLEGYLFPNTYTFASVDVGLEDIIYKLLNETDKQLSKYKDLIDSSSYSVHELLTLASIVELEGSNSDDRKGVAGVFYNRLNNGWTLGSDATTYYANKIDDWTYSLSYKELNNCNNKYNTRCSKISGLPVGPISNPGIESIVAVLEPTLHDYFYFVADCTGKTYLTKNSTEHNNIINKLKQEGKWCA